MSYPAEIVTRVIELPPSIITESGEGMDVTGTIDASHDLVRNDTGYPFRSVATNISGNVGDTVTHELPVTDQAGWLREGELVDVSGGGQTHSYTLSLIFSQGDVILSRATIGPFFLPTDDGSPVLVTKLLTEEGVSLGGVIAIPDSWSAAVAAAEAAALAAQAAAESAAGSHFLPETYGAVGDGVANDTAAVQAAIDAAHAAGGGVVLLNGKYGWTGDLIQKSNVTLQGTGNVRYTVAPGSVADIDKGLHALAGTARLLVGENVTGNSENDNPGPIHNLMINGRGIGGATELVKLCNGADAQIIGCQIIHSSGDGVNFNGHQNFTVANCLIGYHADGTALSIYNATGQGVGNGKFTDCYIATSKKALYVAATAGQFQPHDVFFTRCLFENYDDTSTNDMIHLTAGEVQFDRCVFTNSNAGVPPNDCLVLIEQIAYPAIATMATFESCYFNGGSTGVTDLIRSKGATGNHVRIYGRTHVSNGDYILCSDTGGSDFAVEGAVQRNAGTLDWFRAINGGNLAGVRRRTSQPMRFEIPDDPTGTIPNPMSFRRFTDAADRGRIDRDFILRWLDGADGGTTQGSISFDQPSGAMILGGMWQIQNALVRRPLLTNVTTVAQAVAISAAKTALTTYYLSFTTANATAAPTITGGTDGSQLRIVLSSSGGGNSVTWPGNVFPGGTNTTLPQPIIGKTIYLDLELFGGNWFEVARSNDTIEHEVENRISTGQEAFSRDICDGTASASVSQLLKLSYFTAYKTETIGNVVTYTGGTAAGATPTLCKVGLYSVAANGDLTLVASTANDTAMWAAANTAYTKALTASVKVQKGQRYALATLIVTAAAAPALVSNSVAAAVAGVAPRIHGQVAGQTDLPASVTAGTVTNGGVRHYGELRP